MPSLRRLFGDEVRRYPRPIWLHGLFPARQPYEAEALLRWSRCPDTDNAEAPELDTGTVLAICRQASRFILAEELRPYFYTD